MYPVMSPFQKTVAVFKLLEHVCCGQPQGPGFPVTPTGDLVGKCHGSHPVPAAPLLLHRGRTAQAPSKMMLAGPGLHSKGQKLLLMYPLLCPSKSTLNKRKVEILSKVPQGINLMKITQAPILTAALPLSTGGKGRDLKQRRIKKKLVLLGI